jgi:nucleolar protein 58
VVASNNVVRGIRQHLGVLIPGLKEADAVQMQLSSAHNLSRYKLRFSPDKVDTMIVQAIGLLDELDKEVNTYSMRVREWYVCVSVGSSVQVIKCRFQLFC